MIPLLTIVVCTHNRHFDAIDCLSAIKEQIDERAETILVDSASSDSISLAISQHCQATNIKYIRVDRTGVSLARNVGLRESISPWVVLVDDDAIPLPGWYNHLVNALTATRNDCAAIGGKVSPLWPAGKSARSIPLMWKTYLSLVEFDTCGSVRNGYGVVAANLALRRDALEKIGNFDERLGRNGESLLSCGDSHITRKLISVGYDVRYDPSFEVLHKIKEDRLKEGWILRRIFMEGVSNVRMHRNFNEFPFHLNAAKLSASIPALFILCLINPFRVEYRMRLSMALGSLTESILARKQYNSES